MDTITTVMLVVGGVAILYLGFRLVRRVREMANWKVEEVAENNPNAHLTSDLKSLKLDSDDLQDLEKMESPPKNKPRE